MSRSSDEERQDFFEFSKSMLLPFCLLVHINVEATTQNSGHQIGTAGSRHERSFALLFRVLDQVCTWLLLDGEILASREDGTKSSKD